MAENKVDGQGAVVDPNNVATQPVQPEPEKTPTGGTKPENGSASKDYKLKVNGVDHEFNEAELLEMVSKGLDYTQKTQVVADERKSQEQYKPFIDRMNTDAAFNAEVTEAVNDIVSSQNTNSSDDGSDPKLIAEMAGLRQQVANLHLEKQFETLELKYPEEKIDREAIAAFAATNNITNPEHAYIIMNQGVLAQKATLKGLEDGKAGAVDANKVMVSPGRSGIKSEPAVDVKNMSKLDKRKRAEAQFKALQGKT